MIIIFSIYKKILNDNKEINTMKEISRNMNEKNKLKLKNYQLDLTLLRENQRLKIIIEEDNR